MDTANEARSDLKMLSPKLMVEGKNDMNSNNNSLNQNKNSVKRSFDVAFLMMPDDKCKSNADKMAKFDSSGPAEIAVRSDLTNNKNVMQFHQHLNYRSLSHAELRSRIISSSLSATQSQEISEKYLRSISQYQMQPVLDKGFEDVHTVSILDRISQNGSSDSPKSAFSKVSQQSSTESPIPPLSPDQMSCPSVSPPISASPPVNQTYHNFRSDYAFMNGSAFQAIPNNQHSLAAQAQAQGPVHAHAQPNGKIKQFMYRPQHNPEIPQGYLQAGTFQFPGTPHPFLAHNPAAAILSTFLPTTISQFSMTAQNVCAKCNISFRMTSDLVYHMRSHHKNENVVDPNRRKREEKLKCPVCGESFRERHHLTRHMTAHQDKAGDMLDMSAANLKQRRYKMNH
jgi:PR domain zinc finger protein 8